jgi:spore germination cell wall hydrolase CwlJ-like protein
MKREAFQRFTDTELLAGNMFGEARFIEDTIMDEYNEYIAISNVVMNRVKSHRWPGNIKEVILQKSQFSWLNEADPNSDSVWQFLTNKTPSETYKRMMQLGKAVKEGRVRDFSYGANHYVARWFYEKKAGTNHWSQTYTITAIRGGHILLSDGKP